MCESPTYLILSLLKHTNFLFYNNIRISVIFLFTEVMCPFLSKFL